MNFVYAINTIEGGKRQIDTKIQAGTQFEFKSGTAMLEAAIFQRNKAIIFMIYPQILHSFYLYKRKSCEAAGKT